MAGRGRWLSAGRGRRCRPAWSGGSGRALAPTATGVRSRPAAPGPWPAWPAACSGRCGSIPLPLNEWLLLTQAVLAAVLGVAHPAVPRRRVAKPERARPARRRVRARRRARGAPVVAVGGALGGLTETVVAVLAAAAVGWLAAGVLDAGFFAAFARSWPWRVLVGGPRRRRAGPAGGRRRWVRREPRRRGDGAARWASPRRRSPVACSRGRRAWRWVCSSPRRRSGRWRSSTRRRPRCCSARRRRPCGRQSPPASARWPRWWSAGVLWAALQPAPAAVAGGSRRHGAGHGRRGGRCVRRGRVSPGLYGDRLFVILADQADLSGLDEDRRPPASGSATTYGRLVDPRRPHPGPAAGRTRPVGPGLHAVLPGQRGPGGRRAGRAGVAERRATTWTGCWSTSGCARCPTGGDHLRTATRTRAGSTVEHLDDRRRPGLGGAGRHRRAASSSGRPTPAWTGTHPALRDGYRGGDDSWYDPWNALHRRRPTTTDTARTRSARRSAATASAWRRTPSGSAASTSTAIWAARRTTWTACSSCWPRSRTAATRSATGGRTGPARAHQLVGLPVDRGLRPGRAAAGRRRARGGRHLLRRSPPATPARAAGRPTTRRRRTTARSPSAPWTERAR